MQSGRRWVVRDRLGNEVYLTEERGEHILDAHEEMIHHEEALRDTIRRGRRQQDPLKPDKYRYSMKYPGLPNKNVLVVAIVLFDYEGVGAAREPNNHVATGFLKHVR
jgi:hypothetical protein